MGLTAPFAFVENAANGNARAYETAMREFAPKPEPLVHPALWKLDKIRKVVDEALAAHANEDSDEVIPCTEEHHCRWCELKKILDEK